MEGAAAVEDGGTAVLLIVCVEQDESRSLPLLPPVYGSESFRAVTSCAVGSRVGETRDEDKDPVSQRVDQGRTSIFSTRFPRHLRADAASVTPTSRPGVHSRTRCDPPGGKNKTVMNARMRSGGKARTTHVSSRRPGRGVDSGRGDHRAV